MVYKDKLVAIVKCNGKVLRERQDGVVYLPFGAEYSLHFKNLESRDAVLKLSIDGQDVLDGNRIVVSAGCEASLLGFMKGNCVTHAFKFIHKTKEISEHRGDRLDDGMIRIEYWFVKPKPETVHVNHVHHHSVCCWCKTWPCSCMGNVRLRSSFSNTSEDSYGASYSTLSKGIGETLGARSIETFSANSISCSASLDSQLDSQPAVDEGITTKGSHQHQSFKYTNIGPLEENSHVIILTLKGQIEKEGGNKDVEAPLTVDTKLKCGICGKVSPSSDKYCSGCGTNLH